MIYKCSITVDNGKFELKIHGDNARGEGISGKWYILIPNWCHENPGHSTRNARGIFCKFMSVLQSSTELAHAGDM